MPDHHRPDWGNVLVDLARATLVAGLCWMGVDMASAQTSVPVVDAQRSEEHTSELQSP